MFAIGANVPPQIWCLVRNKTSKQKRRGKTPLPALGAAGLSLALTSGAHAATAGISVDKPTQNTLLSQEITLAEEEISDVSLSTFYVFDKENAQKSLGQQLAWGCRCGGCRCGCAFRACRCGCGGCGFAFRACRCGCGGCGFVFRACRCGCGGCGFVFRACRCGCGGCGGCG